MPELRVAVGKSVEAMRAMPKPAFLSRESIARLLASRRFLQFAGLVVLLIFVSGADIPWDGRNVAVDSRVRFRSIGV